MVEVFRIPFMQLALGAGVLVGAVCSYLSVYVLLKRIVFVGIALAQMSSAGVALALLTGHDPTLFSLIFMLAGVAMLSVRWSDARLSKESIVGVSYAAAAALGILLLYKSASGEAQMLNLLRGNLLAATPGDIWLLLAAAVTVGALHALFHKEFLFVSYDPEMAQTLGIRARLWELLFYVSLGVVIALGIKTAGVLLVFAMLVMPGTAGLILARRMRWAFVIAMLSAVLPLVAGLYISFVWDFSPEASIVSLGAVLLVAVWMVARIRG